MRGSSMQVESKFTIRRVVGAVAVAAATVGGAALISPAIASAAVTAPEVTFTVDGNDMSLTVVNNNSTANGALAPRCQALVVNALEAANIADDPSKLLDPTVVVYPHVADLQSLFGVPAGETVTMPVADVPDGMYAVIGACIDPTVIPIKPAFGTPQLVTIGNPFGGIDMGSLSGGSLEGLLSGFLPK
ncbi:hypothetical protein [Rhodococcus sp. IEGM 1379]|uniref:hypothetical protein n=1 Tax=Rhodococcus sp. IEGM 1379 TaxID=3047086 RepID=UPI0024B8492B|nr:hypothetical protein [Rhodococcus sp. IEGM 1379]MDI9914043.1 hypothetical protein [Rhodococcus sp. IEGM 1379]